MPFPLASGNESVEMSEEDNREWETETEAPATEAGSHSDIYAEDGSVRPQTLGNAFQMIPDFFRRRKHQKQIQFLLQTNASANTD